MRECVVVSRSIQGKLAATQQLLVVDTTKIEGEEERV
jgi:hypothetical protein